MSRIDAAIAAADQPAPEHRVTVQVQLHSGRVVMLNVPVDLGGPEALDLIGYVSTMLPSKLAEAAHKGPRLIVPTHAIARS